MSPERTSTTTLALDPQIEVDRYNDRTMRMEDEEAKQKTVEDIARGFEALSSEAMLRPRQFSYGIGVDHDGALVLLDPWNEVPTPAIRMFQNILERTEKDTIKYVKHEAERVGFTRLQEHIVDAPIGTTYLYISPRDPAIPEYSAMSKLWIGVVYPMDGTAAVRVLDIPTKSTNNDHRTLLTKLGKAEVANTMHHPNDFLKNPLIFRADRDDAKTPHAILESIASVYPLTDGPEKLMRLLFSGLPIPGSLARTHAETMLEIGRMGGTRQEMIRAFEAYLKELYRTLRPQERTGVFTTPAWEAFYYHHQPLQIFLCGGAHYGAGSMDPLTRIFQSINEFLGLGENDVCPKETCRWPGWKTLKKGEKCPNCGTERVC